MPVCPYCNQEIARLYSSLRIKLLWRNDNWVVDNQNGEDVVTCPECYGELVPEDLDRLSVPEEMR